MPAAAVIDGGTTSIQTRNLIEGQERLSPWETAGFVQFTTGHKQLQPAPPASSGGGGASTASARPRSPSTSAVDPAGVETDAGFHRWFQWDRRQHFDADPVGYHHQHRRPSAGRRDRSIGKNRMYSVFNAFVAAPANRTLGDVGMTLGDGAKITFDPDKFQAAFNQSGCRQGTFHAGNHRPWRL